MICAIAIASVVPLLTVSPHEAQRKALRALRAYSETEPYPGPCSPSNVAHAVPDRKYRRPIHVWPLQVFYLQTLS